MNLFYSFAVIAAKTYLWGIFRGKKNIYEIN